MKPNPSSNPRHIAVVGPGAVGLTIAAFLSHAGHKVSMISRTGAAPDLPLRLHDEIGGRDLLLESLPTLRAADLPRSPDHLIVCTRGEQLESALESLHGRLEPTVPIAVAAATLDDLTVLADRCGLANPLLRLAVGFAAWPVADRQYRVFSLRPRGGSAVASESGAHSGCRDDLAQVLTHAGLPTQAAPGRLFRWIYQATLAIEIARLLGYREAGWELDALASDPALIARCAEAMREAAQISAASAGPVGWLMSLCPKALFRRMLLYRTRHASEGFRKVWRYHGPKTSAQLDFVTEQLLQRAPRQRSTSLASFLASPAVENR